MVAGSFTMPQLCSLFGVSKQAHYQYDEDAALAKVAQEGFALEFIKQVRKKDPGIGGVKQMALGRIKGRKSNLIHHSDRGCQYASKDYVKLLNSNGIRISMTESGDPKNNAQAERINNTMKNELLYNKVFHNVEEVIAAVAVAVEYYNNERLHMSIGMSTPSQASMMQGDRDMKWKSLRQAARQFHLTPN